MAHVVVGMDNSRRAAVTIVTRGDITGRLRCPHVVLYGNTQIEVARGVLVTRVTGTRQSGWVVCDAATHLADVHSVLALGGLVEGGLAACSSLPDGLVLVVAPKEVADELADVHGAAWLLE